MGPVESGSAPFGTETCFDPGRRDGPAGIVPAGQRRGWRDPLQHGQGRARHARLVAAYATGPATFCPHKIERTGAHNAGEHRESNVLRRSLEAGRCYVADGGYADCTLFDDIVKAGSSYVVRVREDSVFDVIDERLLSQEALDANVVRDAVVKLGGEMNHSVRLVSVQVEPHRRRTRVKQEGRYKTVRYTDLLVIATNLIETKLTGDTIRRARRRRLVHGDGGGLRFSWCWLR
jgi:hypothetical protein